MYIILYLIYNPFRCQSERALFSLPTPSTSMRSLINVIVFVSLIQFFVIKNRAFFIKTITIISHTKRERVVGVHTFSLFFG